VRIGRSRDELSSALVECLLRLAYRRIEVEVTSEDY